MKRLILLIVGYVLLTGIILAEPRLVKLSIANANTNATAYGTGNVDTNSNSTIGYVNGVYLDLGAGDGTPDIDIDVLAVGAIGSVERTIFSADDVTTDAEHYVRPQPVNTAGTASVTNSSGKIPIFAGDRLVLRGYDSDVTNVTSLAAYIYIDDMP